MQTITDSIPENNKNGEHILVSLTFIGNNSKKNSGIELARVLEKLRRDNEKKDITSALAVNSSYIIQNVEGSRYAINKLLAELINERPHLLLQVIDFREIEVRKWNGFLIRYLTSSAQDEDYALKSFSAGADFNPYLMKKAQIIRFLQAIFEEKESQVDSDIQY